MCAMPFLENWGRVRGSVHTGCSKGTVYELRPNKRSCVIVLATTPLPPPSRKFLAAVMAPTNDVASVVLLPRNLKPW